jgi:hypothetical protein
MVSKPSELVSKEPK